MILDSLLAGTLLFTSFALRTANVQPNPDDYEFSIGVNNSNFYLKRDWEQELGHKYIDDIFWLKYENAIYFKPEYMNKESKGVKYFKMDIRNKWKDWSYGITARSSDDYLKYYDTFISFGTAKKKKYGENIEIEYSFDGYFPPDEDGDPTLDTFEFEDKFNLTYKISEKVSIYNMGEFYSLKGQTFYKAKIGINWRF